MCMSGEKEKERAYYFPLTAIQKEKNNETIACHQAVLAKRAICLIGNTVHVEMRGVERL